MAALFPSAVKSSKLYCTKNDPIDFVAYFSWHFEESGMASKTSARAKIELSSLLKPDSEE